ncbi:MAG: hypothetical protein QM758_05395 [Armatimonas sp.]
MTVAQELVTRTSNRLAEIGVSVNLNEIYLRTFHSVCLRWLQEFRDYTRLKRNLALLGQFEQQYFFYQRIEAYRALPEAEALLERLPTSVGQPSRHCYTG